MDVCLLVWKMIYLLKCLINLFEIFKNKWLLYIYSVADDIFFYCCRRFLKWRTRTLQPPWWPITLPAWPNSEAERSTCSSAITVNSRRIKRTPTTRSVAQQMMSPTPLRSVSYFSLHFFLASLNLGNGCMNAILAELTLFRSLPNTRSLFFLLLMTKVPSKSKKLRSSQINITYKLYRRKLHILNVTNSYLKIDIVITLTVLYSMERRKSMLVSLCPVGDFDASLAEGDRHEIGNPVNTMVNGVIKLTSIVCYLYGLIN